MVAHPLPSRRLTHAASRSTLLVWEEPKSSQRIGQDAAIYGEVASMREGDALLVEQILGLWGKAIPDERQDIRYHIELEKQHINP